MKNLVSGAEFEDSAVVCGIKANDPRALEALYGFFDTAIRRALHAKLGSQDIDDKVHDLFMVVCDAIRNDRLHNPAALPGYIWTVVQHQSANEIGVRVRRQRREEPLGEFDRSDGHSLEASLIQQQERESFTQSALDRLKDNKREILERFYLEEQPKEQIMLEMGLTETQFRLLKSRAKADFSARVRQRAKSSRLRILKSQAQALRSNMYTA